MKLRGLTIAEAIIAIFMLAAGFIVTARCFNGALQYSAMVATRQEAVICAQNRIRTMRAWSRTHHFPQGSLDMDNWGPYAAGGPVADAADPRYQITTSITTPEYYNPCTRFEALHIPTNTDYKMTALRRQITVTASWGSALNQKVSLTTLICAPPPQYSVAPANLANRNRPSFSLGLLAQLIAMSALAGPEQVAMDLPLGSPPPPVPGPYSATSATGLQVTVTPSVLTLHHGEISDCTTTTRLLTGSGPLPTQLPARLEWAIVGPGNGTLQVSRDGRSAKFIHRVTVPSTSGPRIYYADGLQCTIEVTARYAGRVVRQSSAPISLIP
jgi:hypothetical protein